MRISSRPTVIAAARPPEYELLDTGVSTRIVTSTYLLNTPRSDWTTLAYESALPTADPKRHVASIADTLVPQYVVVGGGREQALIVRARDGGRERYLGSSYGPALQAIIFRQQSLLRGGPDLLFTENENKNAKLSVVRMLSPYVKDGINDYVSIRTHKALGTGPNFRLACDSDWLRRYRNAIRFSR
jgi:hypothetical protein